MIFVKFLEFDNKRHFKAGFCGDSKIMETGKMRSFDRLERRGFRFHAVLIMC